MMHGFVNRLGAAADDRLHTISFRASIGVSQILKQYGRSKAGVVFRFQLRYVWREGAGLRDMGVDEIRSFFGI